MDGSPFYFPGQAVQSSDEMATETPTQYKEQNIIPRQPRYPIEEPLQERCPRNDDKALELASRALLAWKKRARSEDNANEVETSPKAPPVRLNSVYCDSRDWPKTSKTLGIKGAVQYSWSNIGFPHDPDLAVHDLEDRTDIDKDNLNIVALSQDVLNVKNRDAEDIADKGTLRTETDAGRTIELFRLNGRHVAKVVIEGVDARQKGVDYKKIKTAKVFERTVETEYQIKKPSLETEHRVMAHVLLSRGGQIGGKACDYWKTARNLAQQHIYLNPGLDLSLQSGAENVKDDKTFAKMLEMVKKCIKQNAFNPYYQAQRGKLILRGY